MEKPKKVNFQLNHICNLLNSRGFKIFISKGYLYIRRPNLYVQVKEIEVLLYGYLLQPLQYRELVRIAF